MKAIHLFSIVGILFLSSFVLSTPALIEIDCGEVICGCNEKFGAINGTYQETKREENGYPIYLGPNKKKNYEVKLRAETPKGADFTVYRWEVRTTKGELIYFDKNIKTEPFPFSETKGQWTAENAAFKPVPNKIERRHY